MDHIGCGASFDKPRRARFWRELRLSWERRRGTGCNLQNAVDLFDAGVRLKRAARRPKALHLPGFAAKLRDGDRLVLAPVAPKPRRPSLLALLLVPLDEEFPPIDDPRPGLVRL